MYLCFLEYIVKMDCSCRIRPFQLGSLGGVALDEEQKICSHAVVRSLFRQFQTRIECGGGHKVKTTSYYVFFRQSASWQVVKDLLVNIEQSNEINNTSVKLWVSTWKEVVQAVEKYAQESKDGVKHTDAEKKRMNQYLVANKSYIDSFTDGFLGDKLETKTLVQFFNKNWQNLNVFCDWENIPINASGLCSHVYVPKLTKTAKCSDIHKISQLGYCVVQVERKTFPVKGNSGKKADVTTKITLSESHIKSAENQRILEAVTQQAIDTINERLNRVPIPVAPEELELQDSSCVPTTILAQSQIKELMSWGFRKLCNLN